MQVLIIGAGPTGLTAGIELARKGVKVTVLDKKSKRSTLSRAVGINPLSLKLLKPSGVTQKLLKVGYKLKTAHFYHNQTPWVTLKLNAASPKQYGYNYMLGCPQDVTEKILVDTFSKLGGQLYYEQALKSIRQSHDKVHIKTESGETYTADYLIGADGANSKTRNLLKFSRTAKALDEVWSIADVHVSDLKLKQSVALYLKSNGDMVFIAPIGEARYRFVSNTKDALKTLPIPIHITRKRREGQFNIQIAQVDHYQKGRVFLAGDAAHTHSPVGGRGMNLGIADAVELAERMLNGTLNDYSKSRHQMAKKIVGGSEVLRKLISSKNPVIHFMVYYLFKLITKVPYLQSQFASKFLYG